MTSGRPRLGSLAVSRAQRQHGQMSDRVTIEIDGGVADVRLNRPEKLNAVDTAMFHALVDAGESIKADPTVRAVVLSGSGKGFCAGLDLESFQKMAGTSSDRSMADIGRRDDGRI